MPDIVLASTSTARRAILENAGITFTVMDSDLDERAAEAPLLQSGAAPEDIATVLAEAKAMSVSELRPDALVIGADQVLDLDGRRMTKPETIEAAQAQLLDLRGRTHLLHSAIACVHNGETVFRHLDTARLTMRNFTPQFLGRYLARVGEAATKSVGAYQIEGLGIQLFEAIEGDIFAIQGLPLLPLLAFLRGEGLIAT